MASAVTILSVITLTATQNIYKDICSSSDDFLGNQYQNDMLKLGQIVNDLMQKQEKLNVRLDEQGNQYQNDMLKLGQIVNDLKQKHEKLNVRLDEQGNQHQNNMLKLGQMVNDLMQRKEKRNVGLDEQGSVYTIWGRKTCPTVNGTELVYSGLTGGAQYNEKGGGVNALCLPHDPDATPSDFPTSLQNTIGDMVGRVYGSEYQFTYRNIAIEDAVPCAVCRSSISSSVLMIPAKVKCLQGWMKQYSGFLSSNYFHFVKSDYICVDENPEYIDGTRASDDNGYLIYPVQAFCGSLPCPPYKNMQYLSCVVCTK